MTIAAENNSRAVTISEEIDFFEDLLKHDMSPDAVTAIIERRDVLRESIQTAEGGKADDGADEGFSPGLPDDMESEAYDADDDVDVVAEDEDHDYVANRNDKTCLVCEQPKEVCELEP